jgi:hypothetical protein
VAIATGCTVITEVVTPSRSRDTSEVNPTRVLGSAVVEHYDISSRSPSPRFAAGAIGPRAASTPSTRSGTAPGTAGTEAPRLVSYGPIRSNIVTTVANDVLSRAVNPSDNTAISSTAHAGPVMVYGQDVNIPRVVVVMLVVM